MKKSGILKLICDLGFTALGWVVSLIGVFTNNKVAKEWFYVVLVCVCVLLSLYSWWTVRVFINNKNSSIHKSEEEINRYLYDWIKKGSRTVIFTRDLTWADESIEIFHLLEDKAKRNELSICLFKKTKTAQHLEDCGAEIYIHSIPEAQLKSRFTIIDYNTNNPKITVAFKDINGQMINERYDMQTNPNACTAFIEMFELVKNNQIKPQ